MPIQFLRGERVESLRGGPSVHYIGDPNKIPTESVGDSGDECLWSNRSNGSRSPLARAAMLH
eukprot:7986888-Lingulodinium_polyedra.AAC.1